MGEIQGISVSGSGGSLQVYRRHSFGDHAENGVKLRGCEGSFSGEGRPKSGLEGRRRRDRCARKASGLSPSGLSPSDTRGKWSICSRDIKNAPLRAVGFGREVFLHAPTEWGPGGAHRISELHAPAYGLNHSPAARHKALKRYFFQADSSLARGSLKFGASLLCPCSYVVFWCSGGSEGAAATQIEDILGCGETGVFRRRVPACGAALGRKSRKSCLLTLGWKCPRRTISLFKRPRNVSRMRSNPSRPCRRFGRPPSDPAR